MNLLAIDTSSVACSVALQFGDDLVFRHEELPREHTRLLMPMIEGVLADAGKKLHDLDGIALGNGPGSFIGMRIGAAVAQGMAHGAGLPIVPVSSLAAIALQAAPEGAVVAVAQDAHMNEVYLGLYDVSDDDRPSLITPERLQPQEPVAELDGRAHCVAAGFGWRRYPALFEANSDRLSLVSGVLYPDARAVLALGRADFEGAAVAPEDVIPAYLREKVAQPPGSRES